jgi:Sigma-70 region 3
LSGGPPRSCSTTVPFIANQAKTIRLPTHIGERQHKLACAARALAPALGRELSLEELAEATGLPVGHVRQALDCAEASASLNQVVSPDHAVRRTRRGHGKGTERRGEGALGEIQSTKVMPVVAVLLAAVPYFGRDTFHRHGSRPFAVTAMQTRSSRGLRESSNGGGQAHPCQ